jgi:hypothetical protein
MLAWVRSLLFFLALPVLAIVQLYILRWTYIFLYSLATPCVYLGHIYIFLYNLARPYVNLGVARQAVLRHCHFWGNCHCMAEASGMYLGFLHSMCNRSSSFVNLFLSMQAGILCYYDALMVSPDTLITGLWKHHLVVARLRFPFLPSAVVVV